MIATVLDYGAGNLHSLVKALASSDVTVRVTTDPRSALDTDVLVLPGVGSFPFAAKRLAGDRDALRTAIIGGLPTLGICLGMQLLFTRSDEGPGDGLAIFDGPVTRLRGARVPHIGWNTIDDVTDADLAAAELRDVYYANSFACRPSSSADVVAWTTHDDERFPAVVRRGSALGAQFHPEKSSAAGVRWLQAALRSVSTERRAYEAAS